MDTEPTRQERRAERQDAERRKVFDNRRSVRIIALLSARPPKRKPKRRRR